MADKNKKVFLLTRKDRFIQEFSGILRSAGFWVEPNGSVRQLLCSCYGSDGCVVLDGTEYSNDEIVKLIHDLRETGFPHAVLVTEKAPTFSRAVELLKLSVGDYFQMNTTPAALRQIVENAFQWSETEGQRVVTRTNLKQCWNRQDVRLKELLRLLYQGVTNQEAARLLNVSLRTVENRRAKLQEVFGVRTFAELVRVATEILEEDPLPPAVLEKIPTGIMF